MINSNIKNNIERILTKIDMEIEEFCEISGVNEYELENLLCKSLVSINDPIISKIAKALNCNVTELFLAKKVTNSKKSVKKNNNKKKEQELLPNFSNINIDLLSDSIAKVDEIILSEGKKINIDQRVRAYLAFYELADNFIKKSEK